MTRRRIDVVRLSFFTIGCVAGLACVTMILPQWEADAEFLAGAVGVFATLSGFVLTVQTIAVSSASARDEPRRAEVLFRVKRLYFFFVINLIAAATGLLALGLREYVGLVPQLANGALLFIAPFALVTSVELPRTLWSDHVAGR